MRCAAAGALLLAAACVASQRSSAAPARPGGYHGVVVGADGGAATLAVAFAAPWARTASGADSVWGFAGEPAGDGWTAYGHLRGDSLHWGLARIAGDAGVDRRFAGRVEADGTVRGCEVAPAGGRWRPAEPPVHAAFVLRPRTEPLPAAELAPLRECAPSPR